MVPEGKTHPEWKHPKAGQGAVCEAEKLGSTRQIPKGKAHRNGTEPMEKSLRGSGYAGRRKKEGKGCGVPPAQPQDETGAVQLSSKS